MATFTPLYPQWQSRISEYFVALGYPVDKVKEVSIAVLSPGTNSVLAWVAGFRPRFIRAPIVVGDVVVDWARLAGEVVKPSIALFDWALEPDYAEQCAARDARMAAFEAGEDAYGDESDVARLMGSIASIASEVDIDILNPYYQLDPNGVDEGIWDVAFPNVLTEMKITNFYTWWFEITGGEGGIQQAIWHRVCSYFDGYGVYDDRAFTEGLAAYRRDLDNPPKKWKGNDAETMRGLMVIFQAIASNQLLGTDEEIEAKWQEQLDRVVDADEGLFFNHDGEVEQARYCIHIFLNALVLEGPNARKWKNKKAIAVRKRKAEPKASKGFGRK